MLKIFQWALYGNYHREHYTVIIAVSINGKYYCEHYIEVLQLALYSKYCSEYYMINIAVDIMQ